MENAEDPSWMVARRGINLLLNDRNQEAEELFNSDPKNINMTAGVCYVTFLNALMCFDDNKVSEAITTIKKIEEQCASQIGWMASIKNKFFFTQSEPDKSLEQELEEKIVLADALVCQSFLTFLHNDFASYMKGGWTLRRAWKIYQQTYAQLSILHKKIFGYTAADLINGGLNPECNVSPSTGPVPCSGTNKNARQGLSQCDEQIVSDMNNLPSTTNTRPSSPSSDNDAGCSSRYSKRHVKREFYSCSSRTISDFSAMANGNRTKITKLKENDEEKYEDCNDGESSPFCPQPINSSYSSNNSLNKCHNNSLRKSISLFSSINNFGSAIYKSATHLIGFKTSYVDDPETEDPETILRLMSAVCFGYGVFRLCVSLAPPYILKWINMLGFEGDQTIAVECLNYSRKGPDMRAPLASLALLWYHTIVRSFFSMDNDINELSIHESMKILREEKEFQNSAMFLFFVGRVERLKPNIPSAIEAYEKSVANASITDVKLLGLHEVGWCHLIVLDYARAHECFLQLRHQSKWSKSFYSYMATINAGAYGNAAYVLNGKSEISKLLDQSHNKATLIDKYIRNRLGQLPDPDQRNTEWVHDVIYWKLYCFEMLYLWNAFPSCNKLDLFTVMETCTPYDEKEKLQHEPMLGIGWLIKGAVSVVLANCGKQENTNGCSQSNTSHQFLNDAVDAFRKCLSIRANCPINVHISAFAQYELALLLLRKEDTRPEGKMLLMRSQTQYKDFDFEQRLNIRISNTLKSVQKYEDEQIKVSK